MARSLTKKLRFDVFKRDGFTCQYCGKTPPSVILEVDHILPVKLNGDDFIDNLITACFDCNRGKSSTPLEEPPQTILNKIEILKEKESQLKEYNKIVKSKRIRLNKEITIIDNMFRQKFTSVHLSEHFKQRTVKFFLERLGFEEVNEAMGIALPHIDEPENAVKYFCGVCWRKIKGKKPWHV